MNKELSQSISNYIEKINYTNSTLNKEEEKLTTRLDELKIERAKLVEKLDRANNPPFDFWERIPPVCEICFFENGSTIELSPISSDNERDHFKCTHCGRYLEI